MRSAAVVLNIGGKERFQLETFTKDNKAYHENLDIPQGCEKFAALCTEEYFQTDIITVSGTCEIKRSKSGGLYIGNKIKPGAHNTDVLLHNRVKRHILDDYLNEPFLKNLGITDQNGRIRDKMQSKYRQINRFLEIAGDAAKKLPHDRKITVYDLCCGKSYLSFALYFYLERVLGFDVEMLGADLKRDVVDYCSEVAEKSSMSKLKFVCGDIAQIGLSDNPDMVVSLRACDTATDIVLAHAVLSGARIILSTPCCHHELFSSVKEVGQDVLDSLSFVLKNSMTAQRLCETMTDSLRAETLRAYGYNVDIIELVSPDDTPKNLLIRAVLQGKANPKSKSLSNARKSVGIPLMLERLLENRP